MVLRNIGGDDKTINANGPFTFSTAWFSGFPYSVTVQTQPALPAQVCTVANGSGTISGNVANVQVVCRNTIGGTVTGVVGTLVLRNNGGDDKTINASGPFTFATALDTATNYNGPAPHPNPAKYNTNGTGTGPKRNVTNVHAHCINHIGGTI